MAVNYPNRPAPWNIGVVDFEVVRQIDPEMADMGNPDGRVYSTCWMIMAQANDGRCKLYEGIFFKNQEEAEYFSATFTGWDPEFSSFWSEVDPVYGSKAYMNEDIEHHRWMEERMEAGVW